MKATDLIEQIKEIIEWADQLPILTASDFADVARDCDDALDEILQLIYAYEDEKDSKEDCNA